MMDNDDLEAAHIVKQAHEGSLPQHVPEQVQVYQLESVGQMLADADAIMEKVQWCL